MENKSMSDWADLMERSTASWESVLTPEEREGGPSPWGNSRYAVFEQCPYKYWVSFVKRMKPETPAEPLEVGGLFHEARARYYSTALALEPTDISDTELDQECLRAAYSIIDRAEAVVPNIAAVVRRLFSGWIEVFGPGTSEDDRFETILVEALIETDRGFPYSTRLDRVIMSEKFGGPVIMEIKTASRRTQDLLAGYRLDSQFLGQQYCWRYSKYYKKYGPLQGYIVDLAVKGNQMEFIREEVPVNSKAMRDWERQKRLTYEQMVTCEIRNYWPRIRANCIKYRRCGLNRHCSRLKPGYFPGYRKKVKGEY
jgi:hypothetical protein